MTIIATSISRSSIQLSVADSAADQSVLVRSIIIFCLFRLSRLKYYYRAQIYIVGAIYFYYWVLLLQYLILSGSRDRESSSTSPSRVLDTSGTS